MNNLYEGARDLIKKSDKTLRSIADSIGSFAKKVSKAISPVINSKLGKLIKSVVGTDRERAWKEMEKATKEVGTAIKQAILRILCSQVFKSN